MNSVMRWLGLVGGLIACGALLAYGITEEVAIGGIEGTITMKENGQALPKALVTLEPVYHDEESPIRIRYVETDTQGKFRLSGIVEGDYLMTVTGKAHSLTRKPIRIVEGKRIDGTVALPPIPPYLELYASQHIFSPQEAPKMQLKGFVGKGELNFSVYRLDFDKMVAKGDLYTALSPLAYPNYQTKKLTDPATVGTQVETWGQEPATRDIEGVFVESLDLKALPEGFYWFQAKGGGQVAGTWLAVSKVGLVGKAVGNDTLAFVTDLQTGEPIPGAAISVATKEGMKPVGVTSGEGTLRFSRETPGPIVATVGDSRAFVDLYRSDPEAEPLKLVGYTDRTIYRPGDTVHFKGMARVHAGDQYQLPSLESVALQFEDPEENVLTKSTAVVSPMGTYSGKFELSREAPPGMYWIVTRTPSGEERTAVSVAAYRKPTYSITVTPEKPSYIRGERVRMKVKVSYYYGGPVPDANVGGSVYRSTYYGPDSFSDEYWGEDEDYGGAYVGEIKATKTDENGEAIIEFETRPKSGAEPAEFDAVYTADVVVADDAGKYYDGQGRATVMRGEFFLAARADRYVVDTDQSFDVEVRGASIDGKPAEGQTLDITTGIERWDGKQYSLYHTEAQKLTLDSTGIAKLSLKSSRPGSYVIRVRAQDRRGNVIEASEYVWIDGRIDAGSLAPRPLKLELDRSKYAPGDRAKILIQTDKPGGSVLLAMEGERLYDTRVVPMTSPSVTVEWPVSEAYSPNVQVTASYIREKSFRTGADMLTVTNPRRELKISIEPSTQQTEPGQTVTYRVRTTTADGQPTPAEVSLAVVDESIFALAEDQLDLGREFYPMRYNAVQTAYSFPDLYLDGGDKAPTSIQVRRTFKDTAFWTPVVTTDATGTADVPVTLPDNLTTWRATVFGITARTEVGKAVSKVVSSKPLMVRLEAPTFMVAGDRQRVAAVVSNRTGQNATVKLQFETADYDVEGGLNQSVEVPQDGTKSVELFVSPKRAGNATMIAKAWIEGGANDGVESTVPILAPGRLIHERFAGVAAGSGNVSLNVRSGADPGSMRLRVTVASTLASSLVPALDALVDFPYGCVEQTMSRFLPSVVVAQAMQQGGFPAPSRAAQIPQIVRDGFVRLGAMQQGDGGWGWWEYGSSDPYMTAYVLDGMHRARQAGFVPPMNRIERALKWSQDYLKKPLAPIEPVTSANEKAWREEARRREIADRAYVALALALWGRPEPAKAFFKEHANDASPIVAVAAVRAMKAMGADTSAAITKLAQQATVSGAIASWNEGYWGVETTGRALLALVEAKPDHPLVPKATRYLLEKRRGSMWYATRDTSHALVALARLLGKSGELTQSGEIGVSLNGIVVGTAQATPNSGETTIDVRLGENGVALRPGANTVELVGRGVGKVYYTVELRQVVTEGLDKPIDASGLSVTRSYHKLQVRQFEDGTRKFAPVETPISEASPGELIQVRLTVKSDRPREFMMVEDPIPAGVRVTEREDVESPGDWIWWWDKLQIFDDRVALFARRIQAGDNVFTYTVRVENPGRSQALPTSVSNMYDPEAVASSSAAKLEVRSR